MALKVKIGLNSEIVVLKSRDFMYFLQIRAFTNKGPTIFTDKGFLQIRA